MLPFVVCNGEQALTHPTSIRASVVRFDLSPVLTLSLFDGSSQVIAGFLISFRIRVLLLESGSSTFYLSVNVSCHPWLLVGVCTYSHCGDNVLNALIDKAVTDVIYSSMPLEESRNIFQSVLAKQSCCCPDVVLVNDDCCSSND